MPPKPEELRRSHQWYLRQRNFQGAACPTLTPQEREVLDRHGLWLWALAIGELELITIAQKEFIRFTKSARRPRTVHEIAWSKYYEWQVHSRRHDRKSFRLSPEAWPERSGPIEPDEPSEAYSHGSDRGDLDEAWGEQAPEGMSPEERDWDSEDYE